MIGMTDGKDVDGVKFGNVKNTSKSDTVSRIIAIAAFLISAFTFSLQFVDHDASSYSLSHIRSNHDSQPPGIQRMSAKIIPPRLSLILSGTPPRQSFPAFGGRVPLMSAWPPLPMNSIEL
jgi:hypothetical protein